MKNFNYYFFFVALQYIALIAYYIMDIMLFIILEYLRNVLEYLRYVAVKAYYIVSLIQVKFILSQFNILYQI